MWPFAKKNKEPEHDLVQETINELKSFRDIGEKFNYIGIEMIVESHYCRMVNPSVVFPRILAAYKDDLGVLNHVEFKYSQLPALRAENLNKIQENIPPITIRDMIEE